jgi:hypothetical protein
VACPLQPLAHFLTLFPCLIITPHFPHYSGQDSTWSNWFLYFQLITLKMEAVRTSETSVYFNDSQSQWLCGLRHRPWSFGRCDHGFESRLMHGCMSSSIHQHLLVTLSLTLYSLVSEKVS